jgi:hypothetical protein
MLNFYEKPYRSSSPFRTIVVNNDGACPKRRELSDTIS